MRKKHCLLLSFIIISTSIFAQKEFIYSSDGDAISKRDQLIFNCLRGIHKDKTDPTALSICECQINKIDRHFTADDYRKHTKKGVIDMSAVLQEDSLLLKEIQNCYSASGKSILLEAQSFEDQFLKSCIKSIVKDSQKKLDSAIVSNFCSCQLEMVKQKKLTDAEMATLSDPNSLLFYEMMYNCGDPFSVKGKAQNGWNENIKLDIEGPQQDTISMLAIDGMNYLKIKIGGLVKVWLLDTGASDMLINKEMEETLKIENVISNKNYLGVSEYEMANGAVESCRKYKVDNIKIGKYILNNIIVSVTEKGKRIIVGKTLLNKFSHWEVNNKTNKLIIEQ